MTKQKRKAKRPCFKPVVVDFFGLQAMGVPYTRTHIFRLMEPNITRTSGSRRNGDFREWVIPNPDPFPQSFKLGPFVNSPVVWRVSEVLAWFEDHGLRVTEDWHRSLLSGDEEERTLEAAE